MKDRRFIPQGVMYAGILAVTGLLAACNSGSSNGIVEEATYAGGLQTSSAVVQETPNGGYRTISGNPVVVVNGEIEPESMLPYGGGEEGIRQAEDETPFYTPDL
jgi:hypothetical protein